MGAVSGHPGADPRNIHTRTPTLRQSHAPHAAYPRPSSQG